MLACPTSERIGSILRAIKRLRVGHTQRLCGALETLGEAHSSNISSTTRVIVAQAIPVLAHQKTPVSDTRQIHKDQSHTSLHARPSTLVTAVVSPHRSSIRTSTCTLGSHKDGCQSSWLGESLAQERSEWYLERGSAHNVQKCFRTDSSIPSIFKLFSGESTSWCVRTTEWPFFISIIREAQGHRVRLG